MSLRFVRGTEVRCQKCIQVSLSSWTLLLQPLHFLINFTDKIIGQQGFDVSQFVGFQIVGE